MRSLTVTELHEQKVSNIMLNICLQISEDFVYITQGQCSADNIRSKEMEVLRALNFDLGRPISIHFLRRFSKIGHFDGVVTLDHHTMAKLALELALTEYSLAHVLPSKTAAAALMLAIRTIKGK